MFSLSLSLYVCLFVFVSDSCKARYNIYEASYAKTGLPLQPKKTEGNHLNLVDLTQVRMMHQDEAWHMAVWICNGSKVEALPAQGSQSANKVAQATFHKKGQSTS